MRLFILFLIPIVFAQAPTAEVIDYNNDFSTQDHFNQTYAQNSSFITKFDKNISVFSSLEIAGMNYLLDNITYPVNGLSVVLYKGVNQTHLQAKPAEGYLDFICDYHWYITNVQYGWRCDFDNDNCFEYENHTAEIYNMTANFTFRNMTETVFVNSTLIPLPEPIHSAMENASGFEFLNISIAGNITYVYVINDMFPVGYDCADNYTNYNTTHNYSLNASIRAGGYQKLFFLKSPVLREQWFRNNQFNVIVLSQIPIEEAKIVLNNNQTTNYTLRNYTINYTDFGLQQVLSIKTDEVPEHRNESSPFPLEEFNHSFTYIYEFTYSYAGLGNNNLSLQITDSFVNSDEYNETLLSRMLSYNNSRTETGQPFNASTARPSGSFKHESLLTIEVALGFLSILFLLIFLNFWRKN